MVSGTLGFWKTDVRIFIQHLSVKIAKADDIVIQKTEMSHSGTGKIEGDGATETSHTYNEDTGVL